ncbi:TorD/DmsD family molecular chaperone [Salipaludibacillus daqingensis]|uniref:TorD/DmsD family molecular chaperone n=1 Tax=Salipaludibacillus daqingensis TaxID=3041001 RepID=UPI0024763B51|nr:molecular chaperone TorD family protein [Salipaludibacillus daqingensis]
MNLQSQISKEEAYEWKSKVYSILAAYYHNQLWNPKDLEAVVKVLEDYNHLYQLKMEDAIEVIKSTNLRHEEDCKFDFNKLFIGPYKLLAPPYESTYLNHDKLLMRAETLSVRSFYEKANIQVDGKGQIPDDHIALELEFIAFLLHQLNQENELTAIKALLEEFLNEHLGKWIDEHLDLVNKQAKTDYCKAWAIIIRRIIHLDLNRMTIS